MKKLVERAEDRAALYGVKGGWERYRLRDLACRAYEDRDDQLEYLRTARYNRVEYHLAKLAWAKRWEAWANGRGPKPGPQPLPWAEPPVRTWK